MQQRLESGLVAQSVEQVDFSTLEAQDFSGHPFVHITFTAPIPIDNIWEFAANLTGNEWADAKEDSLWSTNVTGASTARLPVSMYGTGLGLLLDFYATLNAMGGEASLKQIVAATSSTFLLEDQNGQY